MTINHLKLGIAVAAPIAVSLITNLKTSQYFEGVIAGNPIGWLLGINDSRLTNSGWKSIAKRCAVEALMLAGTACTYMALETRKAYFAIPAAVLFAAQLGLSRAIATNNGEMVQKYL